MKKKEKIKKKQAKRKRLGVKGILKAELPAAIMSRITPLLTIGTGIIISSIILLLIPTLRSTTPLFALLGVITAGYAFWQKAQVLKTGYDEHVFKVVDYTYISQVLAKLTSPTGMLLMRKEEDGHEDGNIYHIAVSGKKGSLPPIDWLVRVYVPKGSEAAQYGDRKYYPVVYGYRIEGEDHK